MQSKTLSKGQEPNLREIVEDGVPLFVGATPPDYTDGEERPVLEEQRVAKAKEEDDARAIREQKREDMTQSRRDHLAKNDGDDDPASVERKKKHDAEQDQYDSLLALMQSPLKSGWSVSSL